MHRSIFRRGQKQKKAGVTCVAKHSLVITSVGLWGKCVYTHNLDGAVNVACVIVFVFMWYTAENIEQAVNFLGLSGQAKVRIA